MSIVTRLLGLLHREGQQGRRPRLSAQQAVELARVAAASDPRHEDLSMSTVQDRSGTLVWIVSTPTIGNTLEVEIDDATAQILHVLRRGSR
jgi:hypothetical protein